MAITRKFFDWRQPALPQVIDWLCAGHSEAGHVDLTGYVLVVPGRRAGRLFVDRLTVRTNGRNAPPEVITPEALPEHLYEPLRPFASDLTQRLAWTEALRGLPEPDIQVLMRNVPEADAFDRWLDLGSLLARHHTELAADGLDFSHVAERGRDLPGFNEHRRWEVLRHAQQRYLALLDDLGLWDQQTARLVAIERRECRSDLEILLLGAVDLNRAQRMMLDQVADRVTALIHAPEAMEDYFDEHGCLIPDRWREQTIDLTESQVRVVDGPVDQASEAAYAIAELGEQFRADQIVVGVADESLVPIVRRQLELCGAPSRPVSERSLPQTLPAMLLEAVAEHLEQDRVETFAALVRHPDLAAWLEVQAVPAEWLVQLDHYLAEHLQPHLGEWLGGEGGAQAVREAFDLVQDWLEPVRSEETRSLGDWSRPIRELLMTIYGCREFADEVLADYLTVQASREIDQALEQHELVPESLGGSFSAAEAIRLTLEAVAGKIVPPPVDPDAVPLLGWLELPLDDAEVAVVTNLNEGIVPSSVNSDLFLPNALRARLGLLDNARRYARDAYALSVVLRARQRVTLILGRRTADGDPLKPSRLLFAAEPEVVARRVIQFYGDQHGTAASPRSPLPPGLATERTKPAFRIPRPHTVAKLPDAFPVTAFKDYLSCPYRFYLARILKLGAMDDQAEELDGGRFGDLLHEVLKVFGRSRLKSSDDAGRIGEFLDAELDRRADRQLGRWRRPAVQLQVEQLRQRLRAFAIRQAEHVELGWEIRFVEEPSNAEPVMIDLGDGRQLPVRGRIDRIDRNRHSGVWRIIDYKTEARGQTPDQIHRRKSTDWVDLQLPLYRHLAVPLGVGGEVQLAYLLLPENSDRTRFEVAEWTGAELVEADELIRTIGRNILDQNFWPPRDAAEVKYDSWQGICQSTAFDGEPLAEVGT
ncbi:MAG: PD-(D/E)XK nuclease family protein [Planctomycetaceae bacterium]|nr:PD-(D/E)XK nuclease family protein [Planctomycetaceae bacterium]